MRLGERYLLRKKAVSFAKSIATELLGGKESSVYTRLLSAASVGGIASRRTGGSGHNSLVIVAEL